MSAYAAGQEIEIVEHYMMARCSGHVRGPAKYSTATVTQVADGFALLDTGERINIATGKLLPAARTNPTQEADK